MQTSGGDLQNEPVQEQEGNKDQVETVYKKGKSCFEEKSYKNAETEENRRPKV